MKEPKDFTGNTLKINDKIVYTQSGTGTSYLRKGVIIGFTPKNVRIHKCANSGDRQVPDKYNWHTCLKTPNKILKIKDL